MGHRWLLLGVLCLAGCSTATLPAPTAESWEIDFSNWPKATEKPYAVEATTFTFCRALRPEELPETHGPHFKPSIVVRVKPDALEDFKTKRPLPVGAVIVKEKHSEMTASQPPSGFTAMIKREPGYDPDHGDWEYADVRLLPEKKVARGKIASCITCHDGKKSEDYLFRDYMK